MAWHRCLHKKVLRSRSLKKRFPSAWHPLRILNLVWNPLRFSACLIFNSLLLLPVWIYELFRVCPLRKVRLADSFLIIGHRGAAAFEIENTIPSFKKALTVYGANALEMDLTYTKDGHVVVWHDWDPDNIIALVRQMGVEPVVKYKPIVPDDSPMRRETHKLTLSELRTWYGYSKKKKNKKEEAYIPTVREVFEWAVKMHELKLIILDIKTPVAHKEFIQPMLKQIREIMADTNPGFTVLFMSPEEEIIKEMKKHAPDLNYTCDVELPVGIVLDPEAYSCIKKAIKYKNKFASVGRPTVLQLGPWTTYRRVIKHDLKEMNKIKDSDNAVERLITWTINRKREMKCLVSMNVSAMVTDRPDRLKKYIQKTN